MDITYGVDEQRIKSVYGTPSGATTHYYLGSYEEEIVNGNTRKIHYLSAGDGLAAIYVQNSNSSDSLYCAYTDYQGSLIAVTDKVGTVRERYAYDAWGLRRNPEDWTKNDTRMAFLFTRGYTFHEHIPEFNLINMNGRMYDPGAGLFFSPDPYIQAPSDWLNYNRYSYGFNNPLIYTDPDGEIAWLIPVAVGAIIGGYSGYKIGDAHGAKGWSMFGYILGGAAIGGVATGTVTGLSSLGVSAWWGGSVGGVVSGAGFSGFASGWDSSAMIKGAFLSGLSGLFEGYASSFIGGSWGAFAGGGIAAGSNTLFNGGNFQDILKSTITGGALAYGTYELTSYVGWKYGGGNSLGELDISYKQFKTIQADYQRSRARCKEYGGILTKNGDVVRAPSKYRSSFGVDFDKAWTGGISKDDILATYHTHWARPGGEYAVDRQFNISTAGDTYRASKGPSSYDYSFVRQTGVSGILIDRFSAYFYGSEAAMSYNQGGMLRYLPLFNLYYKKK